MENGRAASPALSRRVGARRRRCRAQHRIVRSRDRRGPGIVARGLSRQQPRPAGNRAIPRRNPIQIQGGAGLHRKHAPRRSGPYLIGVDASANIAGLNYALRSLAPGGICTSVGFYFMRNAALPLMQMFTNSSTLHIGVAHPRADLPRLLAFLETGTFKPEKVTTLVANWDDAPRAFLERTTKVVVKRDP